MLGSKSGQVMLETDEMSWLWIFTQLKKVQLFLGSLCMSPGCGHRAVMRAAGQPRKTDRRRPASPTVHVQLPGWEVRPAGLEPWKPPACSPQACARPHPRTENGTLSGERVFADVIKCRVKDQVFLNPVTHVLIRDRRGTKTTEGPRETRQKWEGCLEPQELGSVLP